MKGFFKDHECQAQDCHLIVAEGRLMCAKHWAMLPFTLQRPVEAAWRAGQDDKGRRPSKEWMVAAKAAIMHVGIAEFKFTREEAIEAFRLFRAAIGYGCKYAEAN